MTRTWLSPITKSGVALAAAAIVSSSATAQNLYGYGATPYGAPTQNPYGAPAQNPYGVPAQNIYNAPAQNLYGAPAQGLLVYPSRGQSQEQLNRDRYECDNWAVGQTGFDPTRSPPPPPPPAPPANVQAGNTANPLTGNLSGAAIQALGGTLGGSGGLGGAANALVGEFTRHQAQPGTAQSQNAYPNSAPAYPNAAQGSPYAAQLDVYRRAQSACLEGRGYTVK